MNDIVFASMKRARMEAEKEVVSENLVGIDFNELLHEIRPAVVLMRTNKEFGTYDMEFKKGEW